MSVNKPKVRSLASGDVLFREGEVGDFAYQITSGEIEICKFTGDEYVTLSKLKKGDLFGEMALIDRQPRSAMARATKETIVKEIDKNALLNYLKNSPQTAFNMMQQLAGYARNANAKLISLFVSFGSMITCLLSYMDCLIVQNVLFRLIYLPTY